MIIVNQLVLIFFKLVNFGVIIGLAWYLFKRYGLPDVHHSLQEQRAYLENLAMMHRDLQQEQQMIEQQIHDDRKEQDVLKEHLMRWLARVDENNKKLLLQREERKKKLQELVVAQQKQIMQHRMLATVLPQALVEAHRAMETAAKDESVQYKMFDTAVSIMHRNEDE